MRRALEPRYVGTRTPASASVAPPNGPRRSRLPHPSPVRRWVSERRGHRTETTVARRRGLSHLGTTRSLGGRFHVPSSPVPMMVFRTRTPERPSRSQRCHHSSVTSVIRFPTRDRDRADTDVVGALPRLLNHAAPSCATGPLSASNHLHRGTSQVASRGAFGDTFRSQRCHRGSVTGVIRFPTRDRDRTGFVAVRARHRLVNRAGPSLDTGRLGSASEAPSAAPS
jgi:hypothetical protein